ncbi:haloacid dehalogenase-like hydrolase [Tepidibacillus fermentans]|uniref:Haloacid dehalogenase-like hydrolase n=1 Tax=Tepidibacillus fermentans TaxID=1281767 RepID=A0A4R3KFP7_9BACI|nr:haloacid dehalogenase-like hydrolase [Tepidibacillus fermentans]
MIELAGLGVSMGNARLEIKAIADYVTKTNNDHGVWEVFQKFVLA